MAIFHSFLYITWNYFPQFLAIRFSLNNNNKNKVSGTPNAALTAAVKQLLRPLVGLMLDNGLTYGWLSKILKVIYVDVAETEFGLLNKPQTDSRVSLLTGVHRKDVKVLRSEDKTKFEPPDSIFLGARIVAAWVSDPAFTDENGRPAPLSRRPALQNENNTPGFEELVQSVNRDIRPRAILDEWTRLGVVSVNESDQVMLAGDAFIPAKGFEEKAYFLGKNLHDHLAAARANVGSEDPPFLERSVYYNNLSERSILELKGYAEQQGMQMLQNLNVRARELQKRDADGEDQDHRMNLGIYYYDVDED